MDNIEDMPFDHTHYVQNEEELQMILDYNKLNVKTTYEFLLTTFGKTDYPLYKGKNKIELRQKLGKKFNIHCIN